MSYDSVVLADLPLHYYKQNETSGTSITDYGSLAANGTLTGGVTLNQAALAAGLGASMLLNGSSGYISVPTTGLPVGANSWSMETWIMFPSAPAADFTCTIDMGLSSGNNQGIQLYYRKTHTRFEAWGWNTDVLNSVLVPATNTTYHLVLTYDGTTTRLYINGSLNASALATMNVSYGNARIGNDGSTAFWAGYSSNSAWYGTALSLARASAHYTAGTTAASSKILGNRRALGRIQ